MKTLDVTQEISPFLNKTLPYKLNDNPVLPNALCGLAIFSSNEYRGANSKNRPTYAFPTLLTERGKSSVYQTAGDQLNQATADVFCELVRLAIPITYSQTQRIIVEFKADEFLASIDRTRGTANRNWLSEELSRLKRASFKFELEKLCDWETSFVSDLIEDRSNGDAKSPARYTVELNPRIIQIFHAGWKILNSNVRSALHEKHDHLAKGLYSYYQNQSNPYDISVETLRNHMGRGELVDVNGRVIKAAQQLSKWKKDLEPSLANLKLHTNWPVCEMDAEGKKVKVVMTNKSKKHNTAPPVNDDDCEI